MIKVNFKQENLIPDEALADLTVLTNPTTSLTVGSGFIIQNNTGAAVAYVNNTGGLFLVSSLTENVGFS